ncbi:PREDICTED: forkhead box protein I1-like [Priapulus caudatus]|uniref:Forkhead box protein I1-like n=1 Tax=Priapulus caudatus TaxID=37621 RepID=A0ABM1EVS6_PRICU|nr:PREDICTED: forkhead box protein I1-like [Priapulus caudatus]
MAEGRPLMSSSPMSRQPTPTENATAAAAATIAENEEKKPDLSYSSLIAMAILSSREGRMQLYEIYAYIQKHFVYFAKVKDTTWKNSVRHNLSLNSAFTKVGRRDNGRGHYWGIHPKKVGSFLQGKFRGRMGRKLNPDSDSEVLRKIQESVSPSVAATPPPMQLPQTPIRPYPATPDSGYGSPLGLSFRGRADVFGGMTTPSTLANATTVCAGRAPLYGVTTEQTQRYATDDALGVMPTWYADALRHADKENHATAQTSQMSCRYSQPSYVSGHVPCAEASLQPHPASPWMHGSPYPWQHVAASTPLMGVPVIPFPGMYGSFIG